MTRKPLWITEWGISIYSAGSRAGQTSFFRAFMDELKNGSRSRMLENLSERSRYGERRAISRAPGQHALRMHLRNFYVTARKSTGGTASLSCQTGDNARSPTKTGRH